MKIKIKNKLKKNKKNRKKQIRKNRRPEDRKPIAVFIDKKTSDDLTKLINEKGGTKLQYTEKAIIFFCEKVEKLI